MPRLESKLLRVGRPDCRVRDNLYWSRGNLRELTKGKGSTAGYVIRGRRTGAGAEEEMLERMRDSKFFSKPDETSRYSRLRGSRLGFHPSSDRCLLVRQMSFPPCLAISHMRPRRPDHLLINMSRSLVLVRVLYPKSSIYLQGPE